MSRSFALGAAIATLATMSLPLTAAAASKPGARVTAGAAKAPTAPAPDLVSSRVTKTSLGPAGGRLRVTASVKHVTSCRLELLWAPAVTVTYSHNPTTACKSGSYSAGVVVGPNTTGAVRTVALHLVVSNGHTSASSTIYVPVLAKSPAKAKTGTTTTTTTSTTTTTRPSTTTTTTAPAVPPPSMSPLPTTLPLSSAQSADWSGYVAYGGPFTGVQGTFSVPTVTGSSGQEATSEWVGIDGADNSSLIQAGVLEEVQPGGQGAQVVPWWEVLPASATDIGTVTVSPGDTVTVTIWQVNAQKWEIYLVDNSNGEHFSATQSYSGPGSSAEWVVEAPTNGATGRVAPLGSFANPVGFTSLRTAGAATTLEQDTLVQGWSAVATPSALTAAGFQVTNTTTPVTGPDRLQVAQRPGALWHAAP